MTRRPQHAQAPSGASADIGRRLFFTRVGAVGVSTALAGTAATAATAAAGPASTGAGDASLRVALLEEEKTLRKHHQAFEEALDKGRYDDVVEMFTDDAQVVFNGGVFDQRSQGVGRLYRERFRAGHSGRRMESAPGFELAAVQQADTVEVSADLLSASAMFPYSIQVGMPIETETSLASMARLHGGGVQTWWEGGVYGVSYRKDTARGVWKISRLEYRTMARADYRPGRTYATPIAVAPLAKRFPEDPQGPDTLVRAS